VWHGWQRVPANPMYQDIHTLMEVSVSANLTGAPERRVVVTGYQIVPFGVWGSVVVVLYCTSTVQHGGLLRSRDDF
jgi:hypothetical protein